MRKSPFDSSGRRHTSFAQVRWGGACHPLAQTHVQPNRVCEVGACVPDAGDTWCPRPALEVSEYRSALSCLALTRLRARSPDELRIDYYKASGPGGQHVNTTDSAVRVTHLPTKTVVQSQSGRSQHANKKKARAMLSVRYYTDCASTTYMCD